MLSDKLDEAQKQPVGSAKAAEKVSLQLVEVPRQGRLLKREVNFLKSRVSKVAKARDDAAGLAKKEGRQARTPEGSTCLLKVKLDSFEQKELTGCDTKVIFRKVADTTCDTNVLVDGMHQGTFDSYASI